MSDKDLSFLNPTEPEINFDLRKAVETFVSRAVDSVRHYTGDEYEQNRHNWVQITTDRVLAAVMNSLPEPVDTKNKYETNEGGIYVSIEESEGSNNGQQLEYLGQFAEDQGWNKFFFTYSDYLKNLYNLPGAMVQSEHEQRKSIHRESESDSPDHQEPSQVR